MCFPRTNFFSSTSNSAIAIDRAVSTSTTSTPSRALNRTSGSPVSDRTVFPPITSGFTRAFFDRFASHSWQQSTQYATPVSESTCAGLVSDPHHKQVPPSEFAIHWRIILRSPFGESCAEGQSDEVASVPRLQGSYFLPQMPMAAQESSALRFRSTCRNLSSPSPVSAPSTCASLVTVRSPFTLTNARG
jgi:hypothetical protein